MNALSHNSRPDTFNRILATHEDLARKLNALEKKYDAQFRVVFDAIRQLMAPPDKKKRGIGFVVRERAGTYRKSRRA